MAPSKSASKKEVSRKKVQTLARAIGGSQVKPLKAAEVAGVVREEIEALHKEDAAIVAHAAAAIFVLASREEAAPHLEPAIPRLAALVSTEDVNVKRNSCAALTSIAGATEELQQRVAATDGLAERLLECVATPDVDRGLLLNVLNTLNAVAHEPESAERLVELGVVGTVMEALYAGEERAPSPHQIHEAAADLFCALASEAPLRQHLADQGALFALVDFLQSPIAEVQVRSVLALGMLVGGSPERQAALAGVHNSVSSIAAVMRSSDPDAKSVAGEVFMALATNPELKQVVERELRKAVGR